jgi:hypothetical protein
VVSKQVLADSGRFWGSRMSLLDHGEEPPLGRPSRGTACDEEEEEDDDDEVTFRIDSDGQVCPPRPGYLGCESPHQGFPSPLPWFIDILFACCIPLCPALDKENEERGDATPAKSFSALATPQSSTRPLPAEPAPARASPRTL